MTPVTTLLAAAFITFAATNIDDILLLTLFFAQRVPARRIVAGQYLGFFAIIVLSLLGALLAVGIPHQWVRVLGLLPLSLGLKQLIQACRNIEARQPHQNKQNLTSIALITLSNGADNVSVYVPFFHLNYRHLWLILISYAVLVAIWCVVARWLGHHPMIRHTVDRVGHWLVPFVFIGLGVYLLTV
jgi:cadmium resistance protein CadD (predicted permease)